MDEDVRWLDEVEERFWRGFIATSSGVLGHLDGLLKQTKGLTFDDYEVLVHLSEAPGQRLRMNDLSDRLLHSRSRLSQRVDRMVDRGLVAREKVETDARGTWAVLTPDGRRAIEDAAPTHVSNVRTHLLDHLHPREIHVMAEAFSRLAATVVPPAERRRRDER